MAKRAVATTIPEDSTIADVSATLDHPVEYVRRVLEKLERCKRAHGDAQVTDRRTRPARMPQLSDRICLRRRQDAADHGEVGRRL